MANSADPDQLASEEANSSGSTLQNRVYPGSAGQGLIHGVQKFNIIKYITGKGTVKSAQTVKGTSPAVKGSSPAVKGTSPAVKGTSPAVKGTSPAVASGSPAMRGKTSALRGRGGSRQTGVLIQNRHVDIYRVAACKFNA